MALSSQITVNIKAIVSGLPQVKELTKELNTLKRAGVSSNLFAGFERAVPGLGQLAEKFTSLGKNAQNAGLKMKLVNKETAAGHTAMLQFGTSVKETAKSFLGFSTSVKESNAAIGPLAVSGKGLASVLISIGETLVKVTLAASTLAAVLTGVFIGELIQRGVEFNQLLETTKVSVAAILSSAGKIFEGSTLLQGTDAIVAGMEIAEGSIERLRRKAASLGIAFEGVLRGFQEGLGPGLQQARLTLEQLETLIPQIAAAAQTIGLPVDQFAQEIRAIFSGDIDREARVAKLLEIDPKHIADMKGKADELFKFLQAKLVGFAAAGPVVAKTFTGAFQLLKDQASIAAKDATDEFYKQLAGATITALQGIINRATGQFTPAVKTLLGIVSAQLADLGRFINLLVEKAIDFINQLSTDTEALQTIIGSVRGIVIGIFQTILAIVGGTDKSKTATQRLAAMFKTAYETVKAVAVAIAVIVDTVLGLKTVVNIVLGFVANALAGFLAPLGLISDDVWQVAKALGEFGSARWDSAIQGIKTFGDTGAAVLSIFEKLDKTIDTINVGTTFKLPKRDLRFVANEARKEEEKAKKERKSEGTFAEPIPEREKRAAELAKARAEAEKLRIIEAANLDDREAQLEAFHNESLISIKAFWDQRDEITRRRGQLEVEAINAQIAEIQQAMKDSQAELDDTIARIQADPKEQRKDIAINNEKIKQQTEILRLEAQILKLQGQRQAIETATLTQLSSNANAAVNELKEFEKRINSIKSQLGQLRNDPQAGFLERSLELQEEINKARQVGNFQLAALLEEQLAREQQKVDAQVQGLKITEQELRLAIAEQAIQNEVKAGRLSEQEGEDAILKLRKESSAELIKQLEFLRDILDAQGDIVGALEVQKKIDEARGEAGQLSETAKKVNAVFENAFTGLFDAFIDGTKSASEAFRDFAREILAGLAKIIAQMLVMKILKGIFGATGPGGFFGDLLGFAGGGMVRGPGTGRSDSIMARLSTGEYVINARAVQLYGRDFFDAINTGNIPKFADGGLVADAQAIASNPQVTVKNVNVFDPRHLFDALSTPRGEKLFLNFVTRNRQQMRSILG